MSRCDLVDLEDLKVTRVIAKKKYENEIEKIKDEIERKKKEER
jgi:hypothetical protein